MAKNRNRSRPRGGERPNLTSGMAPDPAPLLLSPGLRPPEVRAILTSYGIRSPEEADRNIQAMAGAPHERQQLAVILPALLTATARTADPDQALNHWERLFSASLARTSLLTYLHASPRMLDLLCTIFGNSDALAATLIRDPTLIYWLAEEEVLATSPSRVVMEAALRRALATVSATELQLEALRRFRRREMLKIGVRDLFRLASVEETTASLSDLAALLIQAAYELVDRDLREEHGVPMHFTRDGRGVETGFAVIALGKLGGHELNYSSDVDLIYVYESADGETRRAAGASRLKSPKTAGSIPVEEYFELLARRLTRVLSESTAEGYLFRVDLRLRAEGSVGQLARSLEQYAKYYLTRGRMWERLALLKAYPIAGSGRVGRAFLRLVKRFVWDQDGGMDFAGARSIIEDVRGVKALIDEKMTDRGHERRNVKLGVGGIREIEFLTQTIQVIAGRGLPGIVRRNTVAALARFYEHRLLPEPQWRGLTDAYRFLRDVEHKLQMMHDMQTHSLPVDEEQLTRCAIRMGYETASREESLSRFRADYARHTACVNEAFRSLFYAPERSVLLKNALAVCHQGATASEG